MTQGDALGWELLALQAVDDALVIADVRGRKRCPGLGLMALQAVDDALVIAVVRGWERCPGLGAYGPSGR
ncbi:MAG: hypothetical protein K6F20_03210 [Bacteroidaceae bacterium]|nr:hypothetical protein [Bacteroidaceae bacterium]